MRYVKPELELIRFQNHDILTDSDELPIVPAEAGDELESFEPKPATSWRALTSPTNKLA